MRPSGDKDVQFLGGSQGVRAVLGRMDRVRPTAHRENQIRCAAVMKDWPRLIAALQSDAFEDIAGDLLTGLIAAYFFYVLIDLWS